MSDTLSNLIGGALNQLYSGAASLYSANSASAFQPAGGTISFPSNLIDGNSFYMAFRFEKYRRRSLNEQTFSRFQGGIKLPIPNNLRDDYSASYDTSDLGPVMGTALEAVQRGVPSNNLNDIIGRVLSEATNTAAGAAIGALNTALDRSSALSNIGISSEQIRSAIGAASGIAVNPFLAVLFKSPNFKQHSFSWKMVPRNEQESANIRDIIKMFRYHMLPGVNVNSGLFFSYPSIVQINIYPSDDYTYRFKPCVITDVSINYAPNGGPAFFKRTGAPMAVDFAVRLLETEYWTNEDIAKVSS